MPKLRLVAETSAELKQDDPTTEEERGNFMLITVKKKLFHSQRKVSMIFYVHYHKANGDGVQVVLVDDSTCPHDEIVVGENYAVQFSCPTASVFEHVSISEGGTDT